MASHNKRGLGRGLEALLSEDIAAQDQNRIVQLSIGELASGAHQPRQHMDDDALEALAQSIRKQGILQPLVVRETRDGYEIVAGERRWRAARSAGLTHVPAVVHTLAEETAAAIALIENIQREDLDAMDESAGLARLVNEFGMTHAECAEAVGRSRAAVTNLLRLAELAPEVREKVRDGSLNMGHARALLGLDSAAQPTAARQVIGQRLNVRQTEALVRSWPASGELPAVTDSGDKGATQALAVELSDNLSMPVRVTTRQQGGGRLIIDFADNEQLAALASRLDSSRQT